MTTRSIAAIADWRSSFHEADTLPETATAREKQARGQKFEVILAAMFDEDGLEPQLRYRPKGEEIDGSIWLNGRTILIEAKWTQDRHPASDLYQFRGKVDGKLSGTIGIFISMSGFSSDSVEALAAGKDINVILMDGNDIRAIADREIGVRNAIELKLRAAGDTGALFVPLREVIAKQPQHQTNQGIIFVEGAFDVRVLEHLRTKYESSPEVRIVPTSGPSNMVSIIKTMVPLLNGVKRVTAVIDGDYPSRRPQTELQETILSINEEFGDQLQAELIVLEPNLDSAFGIAPPEGPFSTHRKKLRMQPDRRLNQIIDSIDFSEVALKNPQVAAVLKAAEISLPE